MVEEEAEIYVWVLAGLARPVKEMWDELVWCDGFQYGFHLESLELENPWIQIPKPRPDPSCCAARRMSLSGPRFSIDGPMAVQCGHGPRFGVSSVRRAWAVRPIAGKALEQHHSCRQGSVWGSHCGSHQNMGTYGNCELWDKFKRLGNHSRKPLFFSLTSSLQPLEPMSRQRRGRVDEVHVGRWSL